MPTPYMRSYNVEREYHPVTLAGASATGYRHAATFTILFVNDAYANVLVNLLWNADKRLIKGTTNIETIITEAGLSLSPSGIGWAEVNDIPGEEAWISFSNRIIRFSKRFAVKLPVAPALSALPLVGGVIDKMSPANNWRVEAEGFLDVVTYKGDLQVTIY